MMLGNSKEAYNTLKAVTKTQQHKSAVIEDSSGNILTESTTFLNQWIEYYTTKNYIQTLAYSRVNNPPQEAESLPMLKEEVEEAVHCLKAESPQEWTTFPLSCLKIGARHQQQSSQRYARSGSQRNGLTARHTLTKERQPQAMSKLSYRQPNQIFQQDYAPRYCQGWGTASRWTSWF